jgi:hypothetical protein
MSWRFWVKIDVTVTQEHIDKGMRNQCSICPVALAFRDVNNMRDVLVGESSCHVKLWHDQYFRNAATLPSVVSDRIRDFDSGLGMEPFEFSIEVPDEAA